MKNVLEAEVYDHVLVEDVYKVGNLEQVEDHVVADVLAGLVLQNRAVQELFLQIPLLQDPRGLLGQDSLEYR